MASNESYNKKVEELEKKVAEIEADKKTHRKKDKKTIVRYLLNITVVLIATVIAVVVSLSQNFNQIISYLSSADIKLLLLCFGIMLFMFLTRSIILYCCARTYTKKYHLHQAMAVDQVGIFYAAVTPGATGGEPMQAYTFKKQGIPISSAVSMLAMQSIVYQIVLVLYGLISLIVKYDIIAELQPIDFGIFKEGIPAWVLTIFGFFLNVGVIGLVFFMAYWRKFHNFIMGPIVTLLAKIKLVKNPDKTRENLKIQVENFKLEFGRLMTNVPFFILLLFLYIIYLTLRFSMPYFVSLALGNSHNDISYFWNSVFLANYHQMVTGLIPIPGAAGVTEYFFEQLFYNSKNPELGFMYILGGTSEQCHSLTLATLLVWRSLTFIIPLIFAGVTTAFYRASPKAEDTSRNNMPSRETIISLQYETMVERSALLQEQRKTMQLNRQEIMAKLKKSNKKPNTREKTNNQLEKPIETDYLFVDSDEEHKI